MEAAPWPVLSHEAVAKLAVGVHLCLRRWTPLQVAVENQWSGSSPSPLSSHQKAVQLENHILAWFLDSEARRDHQDLLQLLDESVHEQFLMTIRVDSAVEVAKQLFILHEECSQGNYETVHRLAAAANSRSIHASDKSVKVLCWLFGSLSVSLTMMSMIPWMGKGRARPN